MRTNHLFTLGAVLLCIVCSSFLWHKHTEQSSLSASTYPLPSLPSTSAVADPVSADVFPLGWYSSIEYPEDLAQIKADGMNTVIPYIDIEKYPSDIIEDYLDSAQEVGLRVCLQIPREWVRRLQFATPGGVNTRPGAINNIKAYVNRFKTHPSLLSWYLFDEPNYIQLTSEAAQIGYNTIKELDPDHPVSMVFNRLPGEGSDPADFNLGYLDATDVIMFDYYPAEEGYAEFESPRWENFAPFVARGTALAAEKPGQPYWKVLQAFGGSYDKRLPTAAEERYMLYTSIVSKANGIFFWAHYRSDRTWVNTVLKPIVEEFSPLRAAIARGPVENSQGEAIVRHSSPDNLDLRYQLFRDPARGKFFLVVVNESEQSGTATLGVKPERGIASIRDLRSGEVIPFANNNPDASLDYTFRYSFGPYGTAVFELPEKQLSTSGNVVVRARGKTGSEQIEIRYNDERVGDRITLSTTYQEYKVQVNNANGNFKVAFINDNGPRDAEIDWLEVGSTKRQAETRSTNTAVWQNNSCGGSNSQWMNCNGIVDFGTMRDATSGEIVVRAKGSVGSEQMSLLIDGKVKKSWTVSTTADNYRYEGYSGGSILLRFDNDGSPNGEDRNLAINYVDVCGELQEAEAASNSAGAGCSDTFSGFVWLWCNASLDFGNVGCKSNARTVAKQDKSTSEVMTSEWFRSYPNPVSEQLSVEGSEDYQIVLYDLSGQAVMRHDHLQGKATLDVSHLRPGVYIVRFYGTQHPLSEQKIIIE